MKNSIYLRRKNKVILEPKQAVLPVSYLATAMKNIESIGYTFSEDVIEVLKTYSVEEFVPFYTQLLSDVKTLKGAHVAYQPMYPNFPQQVMEASDAELYINAIIHYISAAIRDVTGTSLPNEGLPAFTKKERFPLIDQPALTVIERGSEEEYYEMITQLIGAKTSISQTDKEDVAATIASIQDVSLITPEAIPVKENLAFFVGTLLTHQKANQAEVAAYFKTATDVLRLAVALSQGDVSLATPTKFKKFKKAERRFILSLLENLSFITEDMLAYKEQWKRLGEVLHPGEYKKVFTKAFQSFDVLRKDKPFETFNTKVEKALIEKDLLTVTTLLTKRPGEFARRLDHVLRITPHTDVVIHRFATVAKEVATPVLLQVLAHFKHRNEEKDLRTFFPKGNVANVTAIENELPTLSEAVCEEIVTLVENTLIERFSELPSLGNVSLDERLAHYLVPFSQRSASKSLRTIVRGSRLPLPEGDTVRFFLWWKEGKINNKVETGRVDIDLSSVLFDENWNYMEHISYTNLRSTHYQAYHSGDITSAPNGACEFIDIDLESFEKHGGRYVVMNLYSYTDHPYCDLPECFGGWMMRSNPNSGEVFEPKTVVDKFDITSNTTISIPVIIDVVEREIIWCDLSLTSLPYYLNNVENNRGTMGLMGKSMVNLVKPTLYELFELHAKARGTIKEVLEEGETYDTIFSVEEGITPTDIEKIMAEFL